jgi:hypothetical protein
MKNQPHTKQQSKAVKATQRESQAREFCSDLVTPEMIGIAFSDISAFRVNENGEVECLDETQRILLPHLTVISCCVTHESDADGTTVTERSFTIELPDKLQTLEIIGEVYGLFDQPNTFDV